MMRVTSLFNRKVVMIGWGGHAKVLKDVLDANETTVAAVVAPEVPKSVRADRYHSDDEFMSACNPSEVILVNAVGSLPGSTVRRNIFDTYKQVGFEFLTIVSEGAMLSPSVILEEGVQVMPGCIIQAEARIGANSIINTGSIIEHDCFIGSDCHIAPKVALSGEVSVGENTHIGIGAVIAQGVKIANNVTIGAGASVVRDVSGGLKVLPGAQRFISELH